MRKRFQSDDVTPVSIKVAITLVVLAAWGVVLWWGHERDKDTYGDSWWIVEIVSFGLFLLLMIVGLIVAAIRRRLRATRRPEERKLPSMRRHGAR